MSEMEMKCLKRINELKIWKRSATFTLNQLFEQLRVAVPHHEFEQISKQLEIFKQQNGDLHVRNKEYAKIIFELQGKKKQIEQQFDEHHEKAEYLNDLEREFQTMRQRLIAKDQNFRFECMIYQKIVDTLKNLKVSILTTFEHFDKNKDGNLDRDEFFKALRDLGVPELSHKEEEQIMSSIDVDNDKQISYKEFSRKLQRYGLKAITPQQMLIHSIIVTMKKLGHSKTELYSLLDKNEQGLVHRQDLKDFLLNLQMKEVSD